MRSFVLFCLTTFLTVGLAAAQDTWEVFGGYQYIGVDQTSLAKQDTLYEETTGFSSLNPGSRMNASGFSGGLQNNINSWFGAIFTAAGAFPNTSMDVTKQALAAGLIPTTPNSTFTEKTNGGLYTYMIGPPSSL